MSLPPDASIPEDEVLTVEEVARLLKLKEQTVRALVREGELPAKKLGKQWRFLRSELLEALRADNRPATPASKAPRSTPDGPPTIAHREAAELLGVTDRTIRRMVRSGRLNTITSPTGVERLSRESVLRLYVGGTPPANDAEGQ